MALHYFETDQSSYFLMVITLKYGVEYFVIVVCCDGQRRETIEVECLLHYHLYEIERLTLIGPAI
jgi:hypothetical protein